MASSASMECGICNEVFNEENHCPKILPCFHCLCLCCVDQLIKTNSNSCPFCRRGFQERSAQEFTTNINLLEILKYTTELETIIRSPRREDLSFRKLVNGFREENKDIRKENQRATNQIQDAIRCNSEARDDILKTNSKIRNTILTTLMQIEEQNLRYVKYLHDENTSLETQLKAISKQEMYVIATDLKLDAAVNFAAAGPIMDEVENINNANIKFLQNLKGFLSRNEKTRHGIVKAAEETKSNIGIIQEILTSNRAEEVEEIDLSPTVLVTSEIDDDVMKNITVDDLRKLNGPMEKNLRSGKVFALEIRQGRRTRCARITITKDDELFLHHLKEDSLPHNGLVIGHHDVMTMVDIRSRLTFLELGDGRRSLGRLLIRLFPGTILSQQFSSLCTGEMGPSYADSSVLEVRDRGHPEDERVILGDYERNDGSGGMALVPDVDWDEEWFNEIYWRPWVIGAVKGSFGPEAKAAQFIINTSEQPNASSRRYFGMVEEGINVLTEAITKYQDITEVCIIDCGIALSN